MRHSPKNYLNRELSWLEFNQRVLDLADLPEIPLLERVKFLAITGSNLDEFIKVRFGGLKLALANEVDTREISGMTVGEQLSAISTRVREMNAAQASMFREGLMPQLESHDIRRMNPDDLEKEQLEHLGEIFDREIASVVTPIAIDLEQGIPLLAGAKLCVCVQLKYQADRTLGDSEHELDSERFVVIPIRESMRRFISMPQETGHAFVLVEDAVQKFLPRMFPDQQIIESCCFRITRNADIALNEDTMHDLLNELTEVLEERKFSQIVRLEVDANTGDSLMDFLKRATGVGEDELFPVECPLDLAAFFGLAKIAGYPELKDETWSPQPSPDFADAQNIFDTIAAGDRILLHPYQQFDPVIELLNAAAEDPDVIAIKQTLYRTSSDSKVIESLINAASNGKQVSAIVELKARFDEERNIRGARRLEQAGVDVIYGVRGLKTHAKLCIVIRREARGIQRYVHFGTGNYNESTARLYSDVSYFTNNEQLGTDAVLFFNAITGLSVPQPLALLAAAPIDLKDTLLEMIQVEIENARQGANCEINAKLNSLVDRQIIDALYSASQAGVSIRLNVRGICCLRPGVEGLSENIKVVSIVDRILEHARVIHFSHGGDEKVFISSADWMGRNLNRRAELLVPIEDEKCRKKLLAVLRSFFEDNVRARRLNADGAYEGVPVGGKPRFRSQEFLYQQACDQYAAFADPKATVFKAHRGA